MPFVFLFVLSICFWSFRIYLLFDVNCKGRLGQIPNFYRKLVLEAPLNDNDETLQMGELDLCRIRSRYQVQSFTQFQLFSVLILSLKESGEGFHQARTAASPFRGDYGPQCS